MRCSIRNIGLILFAAAVITVIAAEGFFPSTTDAFAGSPTVQLDPFKMMVDQKDLVAQSITDLSIVFE